MLTAILLAAAGANTAPPANTVQPVSIGAPHTCAENQYPVSALQTGAEGHSILKFTITKDGHTSDIAIANTSGNDDLDTAAAACARDWMYRPATQNGEAIDAPWMAQVVWQIGVSKLYEPEDVMSLVCIKADGEAYDEVKKTPLHAVVRIHFSGGAIESATLAGSSGNPDLDTRVLACYRGIAREYTTNIPDGDEVFVAMLPPDS